MKAVIKTLSNSCLPEETVVNLAEVIKTTDGRLSYRRDGTETIKAALHKVTLLAGAIVISVPLSTPWVEVRLRADIFEKVVASGRFDPLTLRNDGYHKVKAMTGEYCTLVCLCTLLGDLLTSASRYIMEEYA